MKYCLWTCAIFFVTTVLAKNNSHLFFASNQTFSSSYEIKNSFDTVTRLGKIRTFEN